MHRFNQRTTSRYTWERRHGLSQRSSSWQGHISQTLTAWGQQEARPSSEALGKCENTGFRWLWLSFCRRKRQHHKDASVQPLRLAEHRSAALGWCRHLETNRKKTLESSVSPSPSAENKASVIKGENVTTGAARSLRWQTLEGERMRLAIHLPDHPLFTILAGRTSADK